MSARKSDEPTYTQHQQVGLSLSGGGPLDGGLTLIREVVVDVDDPALPFILTLTLRAQQRRLVVGSFTIEQRDGWPPVTGKALRSLRLDFYTKEILRELLEIDGGGVILEEVWRRTDAVAYATPTREAIEAHRSDERQRVPIADSLPKVAHHYQMALGNPDDAHAPTAAVGRALGYSRGHAARLVSEARKAGLLGPARVGLPGEAETTKRKRRKS